jgi:hypothetical protein
LLPQHPHHWPFHFLPQIEQYSALELKFNTTRQALVRVGYGLFDGDRVGPLTQQMHQLDEHVATAELLTAIYRDILES